MAARAPVTAACLAAGLPVLSRGHFAQEYLGPLTCRTGQRPGTRPCPGEGIEGRREPLLVALGETAHSGVVLQTQRVLTHRRVRLRRRAHDTDGLFEVGGAHQFGGPGYLGGERLVMRCERTGGVQEPYRVAGDRSGLLLRHRTDPLIRPGLRGHTRGDLLETSPVVADLRREATGLLLPQHGQVAQHGLLHGPGAGQPSLQSLDLAL